VIFPSPAVYHLSAVGLGKTFQPGDNWTSGGVRATKPGRKLEEEYGLPVELDGMRLLLTVEYIIGVGATSGAWRSRTA
jgi:hypothetical protein